MEKIKYNFDNIDIFLGNVVGILKLMNSLDVQVNGINLNEEELIDSLRSANKSTCDNINYIIDVLGTNSLKINELCKAYQDYERSKITNNDLLNKHFKEVNINSFNYVIKSGDTLTSIAMKNNISVDELVNANKDIIKNKNKIYVGDTIIIPVAGNQDETNNISNKKDSPSKENNGDSNNNKGNKNTGDNGNNTRNENNSDDANNINNASPNTSSGVTDYKYKSNTSLGFNVTYNNKKYSLSDSEKDVLYAIVAAESDKSQDDALAVVSTILNRCENPRWVGSYGTSPYAQATAYNQYVVYQDGVYKRFINGQAPDTVKNAVNDALNGVRNHSYLSFKSNETASAGNKMITPTGNRFHN